MVNLLRFIMVRKNIVANNYFEFKQFTIHQEHAAFKITTDSVLLGAWVDLENAQHVLDIGTGTGILALMTAQRTNAYIVALEPEPASFRQAALNIAGSPWHQRITLVNGTIQDYNPDNKKLFDTIITNPPFFIDSLPNPDPNKAIARHSIVLSHQELIINAVRLLAPEGTLQLVLPVTEAEQFISMASGSGLLILRRLNVKPTPSLAVVRVLMTLGRQKGKKEVNTIVIETGGRHHYSDEYVSLTKDFYLKF
jgi:tRNA1Val (adenine37-N6)-methyltransferase